MSVKCFFTFKKEKKTRQEELFLKLDLYFETQTFISANLIGWANIMNLYIYLFPTHHRVNDLIHASKEKDEKRK